MRNTLFLFIFLWAFGSYGQDADQAWAAFNKAYYHPSRNIYMTHQDQESIAAIWTQAIYWDMALNVAKRTGKEDDMHMVEAIYRGNYKQYDGFNFNNTEVWFIYDDIQWWVVSFARAYLATGDEKYLAHAILGFDRVWAGTPQVADKGAFDPERGGMYWGWKADQRGKTACINYPTVVAALLLYEATKNSDYLDRAKLVYDWSKNNLFDAKTGKVGDHQVPNQPTNWTTNLYNQAACIGAGALLHKHTRQQSFLNDALLATRYIREEMCDEEGLLPYKNGIEQGIYAAIFAEYIQLMFPYDSQNLYRAWMRTNIHTAWANRNDVGLMDKNFKEKASSTTEVYDASAAVALLQILN